MQHRKGRGGENRPFRDRSRLREAPRFRQKSPGLNVTSEPAKPGSAASIDAVKCDRRGSAANRIEQSDTLFSGHEREESRTSADRSAVIVLGKDAGYGENRPIHVHSSTFWHAQILFALRRRVVEP